MYQVEPHMYQVLFDLLILALKNGVSEMDYHKMKNQLLACKTFANIMKLVIGEVIVRKGFCYLDEVALRRLSYIHVDRSGEINV